MAEHKKEDGRVVKRGSSPAKRSGLKRRRTSRASSSTSSTGSASSSSGSTSSSSYTGSRSSGRSPSPRRRRAPSPKRFGAAVGRGRRSPSRSPPRRQHSPPSNRRRPSPKRSPPRRGAVADGRKDAVGRGFQSSSRSPPRRQHSPPSNRRRSPPPEEEKEVIVQEKKRLMIRNLSRNVSKAHLAEIFGVYGATIQVDIVSDPVHPNLSTGKGYVDYEKVEDAEKAARYFDGGQIDGLEVGCELANIATSRPKAAAKGQGTPTRGDERHKPIKTEQTASSPRQRRRSPVGGGGGASARGTGANRVPIGEAGRGRLSSRSPGR